MLGLENLGIQTFLWCRVLYPLFTIPDFICMPVCLSIFTLIPWFCGMDDDFLAPFIHYSLYAFCLSFILYCSYYLLIVTAFDVTDATGTDFMATVLF